MGKSKIHFGIAGDGGGLIFSNSRASGHHVRAAREPSRRRKSMKRSSKGKQLLKTNVLAKIQTEFPSSISPMDKMPYIPFSIAKTCIQT